ncbi:MAG: hypothetical protein M0Z38_07740 [Deltaproteobacteria bacterium]|nr:hypothetical protein [Deltaproteobacteria bacterium]
MPVCELLPTCPFFNEEMTNMPVSMSYVKESYCAKDNSLCARYIVYSALGREKVPANLYPTEIMRAKRLISTGKI